MQRERIPCVYILASAPRGTLYVGVTSNLPARIWQHKNDQVDGFSKKVSDTYFGLVRGA